MINDTRLFTQARPKHLVGKILQFPLIRILIAFLFFIPFFRLHPLLVNGIIRPAPEPWKTILFYADTVVFFLLMLGVYSLYTRWIEKRQAHEIRGQKIHLEFGIGFGIGMVLVCLTVGVMAIFGYYRINSLNPIKTIILYNFFLFSMKAFVEELLFRLILFRLTEELLGSWIALFIQALIFGFMHMGNPNATLWSSLAIVVVGGLLLTSGFMLTRRIWLPLGLHISWNYFQSGIFGMPCSGIVHDSLINPVIEGPSRITGGDFGIEMSWFAISLCLIVSLILLKKAISLNRIAPLWRRK